MMNIPNPRIVYLHRIRNYANAKESAHVVRMTEDITKAFDFLKMDYEDYQKQQFKSIFEYTEYMVSNCRYITVDLLKNLEAEVNTVPENLRTEVQKMMIRFVEIVKIGHYVLRDFKFVPVMMYLNLRESIVRNFFDEVEVQDQFVDLKFRYQKDTELQGKFSPKLVVTWVKPLKHDSRLTGIFTTAFVNYVTQNKPGNFPRFMIDTDVCFIRKEVISYYYNLFDKTTAYLEYKSKKDEVK